MKKFLLGFVLCAGFVYAVEQQENAKRPSLEDVCGAKRIKELQDLIASVKDEDTRLPVRIELDNALRCRDVSLAFLAATAKAKKNGCGDVTITVKPMQYQNEVDFFNNCTNQLVLEHGNSEEVITKRFEWLDSSKTPEMLILHIKIERTWDAWLASWGKKETSK